MEGSRAKTVNIKAERVYGAYERKLFSLMETNEKKKYE